MVLQFVVRGSACVKSLGESLGRKQIYMEAAHVSELHTPVPLVGAKSRDIEQELFIAVCDKVFSSAHVLALTTSITSLFTFTKEPIKI